MQSTTQAFELRDGDMGREAGGIPDRQVGTARGVIVDDNQRGSAALAAALKLGGGDLAVIVVAADNPALRSLVLPANLVLLRAPAAPTTSPVGSREGDQRQIPFHRGHILLQKLDAGSARRGGGGVGSLQSTRMAPQQR